jgi:hypothetical protein
MTEYVPDNSKKQPLFEIFRAAVWSSLLGEEELNAAEEAGRKAGVTEKDLETISQWDAKQLKNYFGDAAFNRDLVSAMKASDAATDGMSRAFGYGSDKPFKKMGFY